MTGYIFAVDGFLGREPLRGPLHDLRLLLKLPAEAGMTSGLVDAEIGGGVLGLSVFADERGCACTEFWWIRARHVGESFMKAVDSLPRVETKL